MPKANLTTGSVPRALAALTGPMILGVLAVMSVGLADAYFVGRLGETELAAISFIFPVTTALTSLGIGLSAGANATISQALGGDEEDRAQRFAAHAVAISVVLGAATAALGLLGAESLFRWLNAEPEQMPHVLAYMEVWLLGFPLLTSVLVVNAAIRAHGSTIAPAGLMVLNAVFNGGLDPVLILGWGPIEAQGIAGAAQATVIAFGVTLLASAWPVFRTFSVTQPRAFLEPGYLESWKEIATVGGPAALANAINPAALAAITALVARFGAATVAGFGAAGRVESFAIVPLLGLSGSIGPMVGQNWGARRRDRVGLAVRTATLFCVGYGLVAAIVLTAFAEPIAGLFAEAGAGVQLQATLYLRIVSWSLFGYGVVIVINASLNARSRALQSMSLSLGRVLLLYLPLALLGARLLDQIGVYGAAATANLGGASAAIWLARRAGLWSGGSEET